MNKLTGYIIAAVGLVIMVASFKSASVPILNSLSIKPVFIMIAGIAIIILGVALTLGKGSKAHQVEEEVPIYHGKKIVGYRKAE